MFPHPIHQIEIGGLLIAAGIVAAVVYVLLDDSERDPLLPFAMFALTSIMGLSLVTNVQLTSINSSIDVLEAQMKVQHSRGHANRTGTSPDQPEKRAVLEMAAINPRCDLGPVSPLPGASGFYLSGSRAVPGVKGTHPASCRS